MHRALSVYLDALRFLSAIAVYLFHAGNFTRLRIPFFGGFGSQAVMVFFVLSGLVIAYASAVRRTALSEFAVARLARLWSVVVPALILTLLLDTLGQHLVLASYAPMQPYNAYKWAASLLANALFLNQIWGFNIWPGTNGPFWSLSYEAWYYLIFAVYCFCAGWRRWILSGLVLLCAGPKIAVALPIWVAGVWVYRAIGDAPKVVPGLLLWGGSLMAAAACAYFEVLDLLGQFFPGVLAWAARSWAVDFWPHSYLIGALVAIHILGFAWWARHWDPPALLVRAVKALADTSFGLYLMHYPLLYFVRAVLSDLGSTQGSWFVVLLYVLPLLLAMLLARGCEPLKPVIARTLRQALVWLRAWAGPRATLT